MKKAKITLQKEDNISEVVAKSLLPEMDRNIPRTKVNLREDENSITIEIQAKDTSALRAALNSYLRWIKVTVDTYEETQNKS